MSINELKILRDKDFLSNEDIDSPSPPSKKGFLKYIEKQTGDDVWDIYYASFVGKDSFNSSTWASDIFQKIDQEKILFDLEEQKRTTLFWIIFKDLEHERRIKRALLDEAKKGKKVVNDFFDYITPVYEGSGVELSLEVDQEGINYLEYETKEEGVKKARAYNISMEEMQKLYNVTGAKLFEGNVRQGLPDKKAGKELRERFKKYLKVGVLIKGVEGQHFSEEFTEELNEYFKLKEVDQKQNKPELFWYKNNGISIFVDPKDGYKPEARSISIKPDKVSVINGAQTLTNMFLGVEELLKQMVNINDEKEEKYKELINEVLAEIYVKVIFIEGDKEFSEAITEGLNNQIPIRPEDLAAIFPAVKNLNKVLEKYQTKILKAGESPGFNDGYSPLEFVKSFLIVDGRPGTSKNFGKDKLKEELENALEKIKKDKSLMDKMRLVSDIEKWWNAKNKSIEKKEIFDKYGKCYFQSYVLLRRDDFGGEDSFKKENLDLYKENMKEDLIKLKRDADMNDYKSDALFNKIKALYTKDIEVCKLPFSSIVDMKYELLEYITNSDVSSYAYASRINKFLSSKNIEKRYFRTISEVDGRIQEYFPLPNSTFEELYIGRKRRMGDIVYPKFENSKLKKELGRSYPLFVMKKDKKGKEGKLIGIEIMENFTLNHVVDDAKKVFDLTVEAFKAGEEKQFPKVSDDKVFHIRPKAIDSNDTFLFTDGREITKRTFWVNKTYIESLLKK